jgi:hypothetical protein
MLLNRWSDGIIPALYGSVAAILGLGALMYAIPVPELQFPTEMASGVSGEVWYWFNAHGAPISYTVSTEYEQASTILADPIQNGPAWLLLLYALPAVVCIPAGYLSALSKYTRNKRLIHDILVSSAIGWGYYAAAAVLFIQILAAMPDMGAETIRYVGPPLNSNRSYIALLYPLLCGAVGGFIYWLQVRHFRSYRHV